MNRQTTGSSHSISQTPTPTRVSAFAEFPKKKQSHSDIKVDKKIMIEEPSELEESKSMSISSGREDDQQERLDIFSTNARRSF